MNSCAIAADMTQREGQTMTQADKDAMLSAYIRRGASMLTGDVFAYGFAAGLAHAREQAAAQLEARASIAPHGGIVARILREEAEKIRSGS